MTLQYKLLAAVALLLLAFAGGSAAAYKFMVPKLEIERNAKAVCQHANEGNDAVIRSLQNEVVKAQSSCAGRLKQKDETIRRMQAIDNLTPGGNDVTSNNTGTGDPILVELNRMFSLR